MIQNLAKKSVINPSENNNKKYDIATMTTTTESIYDKAYM